MRWIGAHGQCAAESEIARIAIYYSKLRQPAFMTKCSIAPDTAFEKTSFYFAVLSKFLFPPSVTVLSTETGVQRIIESVTAGVTQGLDLAVNVLLWVL